MQGKLNNYGDKAALKNIFAVGLFAGLAIACKWSGLFSLPAIIVVLVWAYLANGAKPVKLAIIAVSIIFSCITTMYLLP